MSGQTTVTLTYWLGGRGDRWFWTRDPEAPDGLRGPFQTREAAEADARRALDRAVKAVGELLVEAGIEALAAPIIGPGWIPRGKA